MLVFGSPKIVFMPEGSFCISLFEICFVFILHVSVFDPHVCVCRVLGSREGRKRASDPLRLESPVTGSHCVGAGNETWVLCESSRCS